VYEVAAQLVLATRLECGRIPAQLQVYRFESADSFGHLLEIRFRGLRHTMKPEMSLLRQPVEGLLGDNDAVLGRSFSERTLTIAYRHLASTEIRAAMVGSRTRRSP
jgi:hypothetical protein